MQDMCYTHCLDLLGSSPSEVVLSGYNEGLHMLDIVFHYISLR